MGCVPAVFFRFEVTRDSPILHPGALTCPKISSINVIEFDGAIIIQKVFAGSVE